MQPVLSTPPTSVTTSAPSTPLYDIANVPLSEPNSLTTPKSTISSTKTSDCLTSEVALESFLSSHVKSEGPLARIKAKTYSIEDRREVSYVVGCKIVDIWGCYPTKETMISVSTTLSKVTGISPLIFFLPSCWKGGLMRSIENSRRNMEDKDKKWTWSESAKKKLQLAISSTVTNTASNSAKRKHDVDLSSASTRTTSTTDLSAAEDSSFTGCCRQVEQCEHCRGTSILDLSLNI